MLNPGIIFLSSVFSSPILYIVSEFSVRSLTMRRLDSTLRIDMVLDGHKFLPAAVYIQIVKLLTEEC